MKIKTARFVTSVAEFALCPSSPLPEFAFIGRSNVGKSSLINLLCNQRGLAQISGTPGKTATINFYVINEAWTLVDLPGYGYAKTAKSIRERFQSLISDYLTERENLRHIFVLIDGRHPPQRIDLEFVEWLIGVGVPFSLVFTKADKIKPSKVTENQGFFLAALAEFTEGEPSVHTVSAVTKQGRIELLSAIQTMIA